MVEDLPIHEYYRRGAEGMPALIDLLKRIRDELAVVDSIRPKLRGVPEIESAKERIDRWLSDPEVHSAIATAAALSLSGDQLYEPVVISHTYGHNVFNIINGVYGQHALLRPDHPLVQDVRDFYDLLHSYQKRLCDKMKKV